MRLPPLTPAAERALCEAGRWTSSSDEAAVIDVPQMLVGLVGQPECRAAQMLAERGIDAAAIRRRWPQLAPSGDRPPARIGSLSPDAEAALATAEARVRDFLPDEALATEHLLLGLAAGAHDVSVWLGEHQLSADDLEAAIHRRWGHDPTPIPVDEPLPLEPSPAESSPGDLLRQEPDAAAATWRVLDAAANRAREGLRVAEDYVRFVLDDVHLTGLVKGLRHDLAAALSVVDEAIACRATQHDVGTPLTTASEARRGSPAEVCAVNVRRAEESLRSLEEFGKLVDADLAHTLKQLRYRLYTFERAVDVTQRSLRHFQDVRLYVLVSGMTSPDAFAGLVEGLVAADVDAIQLRDKTLDDRLLAERARIARQRTRGTGTLLIVNDRADIAVAIGADGVHVGQDELSAKDVRSIVGPAMLIGVSTHSIEQARSAVLDGADYVGVGPVFASQTKEFSQLAGLDFLKQVAAEIRLPAFAIGGIDASGVAEVLAAGIGRVAIGAAIVESADPAAAARSIRRQLVAENPEPSS